MVTAVLAGLAVTLALDVAPAAARRSHPPDLFRELFGPPIRSHRAHHPRASREKRANEKATSAPKAVSEPKPAANPNSAAEPKAAEPDSTQPKTAEPKSAEPKSADKSGAEARPAPEPKSASEPHETREAAGVKVPLPQPRPAEAPKIEPDKPATAKAAPAGPDKPAEQAATATPMPRPAPTPEGPPPPSTCRLALTEEIAIAPSVPDIHGPGDCGGEDLVRLEAIVLPDRHRVAMKPAATMRCGMAAAIADWVRTDVEPLAQGMGSELTELQNLDAYECRGRNGISGAPLSEHGRANAIDVHGFKLANGKSLGLTDRNVPRETRESVLHSVCTRFTTVLGPGSDGYHEDHIHLDLLQRHNNYKICQWNVWDPLPQVAPLMPEVRPDDAPPRQLAGNDEGGKSQDAKNGAKGSDKGNDRSHDNRGHDGKTIAAPAAPAEPSSKGGKSNGDKSSGSKPDDRSEARSSKAKSDSSKSEKGNSERRESARSRSKSGKYQRADESEPDDEPVTKKRRHGRRF
jgi:hypothetical protein